MEVPGGMLDRFPNSGECKRVAAYTIAIAKNMGLSRNEIEIIARGAFLHNIGQLAISEAILNKRGELSPEEKAIVQGHPYRGYLLLQRNPALKEAAEIVYAHHERYDGTGYPRRLKGDEIPVGPELWRSRTHLIP